MTLPRIVKQAMLVQMGMLEKKVEGIILRMLVGHQIIKTSGLSANNKVNSSTHLGGVVIGNSNGAEAKKLNEINGIGLGFQGHGADVGLAGNGLEFQSQPNTFQGSRLPTSSFGPGAHNPSPLMMNMQDINTTHLLV
ncbi:hypothetical protein MRB53_025354 [Persea americana]|uniref:Uncharacterized protein n=1 Tax=Persea americana TaxID=3435 RepID=A0ACC2LFB5_PERAE|nr:hypothetical protein MRB53_025354 [Persea americana]